MKIQHLIISLLLFFLSYKAHANNAVIRLAFVQGKVTLSSGSEVKTTSIGMTVPKNAILHLNKNAQIILKDSKNRYCVIETLLSDKKVNYNQLDEIFRTQENAGLMNSILEFMSKEIKNQHYNVRDYAADNLKKKGGVTRDGCTYPLMLYPGTDQQVADSIILFKWSRKLNERDYILEVYYGDEYSGEVVKSIFTTNVADTFFKLPISAFKDDFIDQTINWVAYPKTYRRNCARYFFTLISESKRKEIISQIDSELKDFRNQEDKLSQKAFLLEAKGLMKDSESVYRELISKYNTKTYNDLFQLFQLRNGLYGG